MSDETNIPINEAAHATRGEMSVPTEEKLASLNRPLPFSGEAETGLLSCILHDPESRLGECKISVPAAAFYHSAHRKIYEALLEMGDAGIGIDVISLTVRMKERGTLDAVGGAARLSEIATFVPIPAHYPFYRRVLLRKWERRQLIRVAAEIMEDAHEPEEATEVDGALIAKAQERVFALTSGVEDGDGGEEHSDVVERVLAKVEAQLHDVALIPDDRIPTGFTDLDRMCWGWIRGQVVVLAARPSMGKSALADNIANHVSLGRGHYREYESQRWNHRAKKKVMHVNLEMTNDQCVTRELVGGAGLDLKSMRHGMADHTALEKLKNRALEIYPAQKRMYDRPGLSIQKLRAIARVRKKRHGLDLIVIDYLQLMCSESNRARQNRQLEVAEISAGLKEMAKELDVVVLVLAQLNRGVEERANKKPQLSDLRESGSIEQDADIVLLLYRECYYNEEAPKDDAMLIVAKGRDVGLGEINLKFHAHRTEFVSTTFDLFSGNPEHRQQ